MFQRRDQRLSFQNLPESYLKVKLRVHVHCRLLPFDLGDAKEFCAVFERYPLGGSVMGRVRSGNNQSGSQRR